MPIEKPKKTGRRRTFLREWRLYRNLTQVQAAERLEIDQSTLSRIERGATPYDQDFLESAAVAYNCEPQDLIMRNPLDRDAIWTLAENLKKAPAADQARAVAVIEALLRKAS